MYASPPAIQWTTTVVLRLTIKSVGPLLERGDFAIVLHEDFRHVAVQRRNFAAERGHFTAHFAAKSCAS